METKCCEGWWWGHPTLSLAPGGFGKRRYYSFWHMFRSPSVTQCFVIPWSFLAIRHPESQVKTGTQVKKSSQLMCLCVLLNPRKALSTGLRSGWVCNSPLHMRPLWSVAPRGGKGLLSILLRPLGLLNGRATCRFHAGGWSGGSSPPPRCLWVKPRYLEVEVGFAYLC